MEKKPQQVNKGMVTDFNEEFQPTGTYRFMLNGKLETASGEKNAVSNEEGTTICAPLPSISGLTLIGTCLLDNDYVVLFLTNGTISIIARQSPTCVYEELIRTECMSFNPCTQVDCIFKLHNGCEHIIYFTDGVNRYRSINIDALDKYVKTGYSTTDSNLLDPNIPIAGVYGWECSLFSLSPDLLIPDIYLLSVNRGGRLRVGSYQFAIRYLDSDFNPTDWVNISNSVYITQPAYNDAELALNNGGSITPSSDGFTYTDKNITLQLEGLDLNFEYYQIGVLESSQTTSTVNKAYLLPPLSVDSTSAIVRFDSLNQPGILSTVPGEITVPKFKINIIQAHTQTENRLVLGNHTERVVDWTDFQKSANAVKVQYFAFAGDNIKDVDDCPFSTAIDLRTDFGSRDYAHPVLSFDHKTMMRDEIYALGIVWVFNDGFESPVFHIPGRPAITALNGPAPVDTSRIQTYTIDSFDYTSAVGEAYWAIVGDIYNIPDALLDDWDDYQYTISPTTRMHYFETSGALDFAPTEIAKCENIYNISDCADPDIFRWHHVNTSIDGADAGSYTDFHQYKHTFRKDIFSKEKEIGLMAFYETDTKYPTVKDCEGVPIFPHNDLGGGTYEMHKIRHHKMPDSRKVPIMSDTYELMPLGVRVVDVVVPVEFADQIQGYYIVRGDRAGNKTVIDKGWMNVCDVTYASYAQSGNPTNPRQAELQDDYKTIEQNMWFMTPTAKNGFATNPPALDDKDFKNPPMSGFDVVEFFSPKSIFNDRINLGGDYYRLENTLYSVDATGARHLNFKVDVISTDLQTNTNNWVGCMHATLNSMVLPKTFAFEDRLDYYFAYNLPIVGSEYAIYNQLDTSSVVSQFVVRNTNHRQRILLSKLFYESVVENQLLDDNVCFFNKPMDVATFTGGFIDDWLFPADIINFETVLNSIGPYDDLYWENDLFIDVAEDPGSIPGAAQVPPGIWAAQATPFGEEGAFWHSPYVYYAALKSSIIPYRKLDVIKYIKMHNYVIPKDETHYGISGGDTYISKQQMLKTHAYDPSGSGVNQIAGTTLMGYVESEINANLRHINTGDDYKAYPWNTFVESEYDVVIEVLGEEDALRESIEQIYRYNLDFSKDNNDKLFFPLADGYQYCSDCQQVFTTQIIYSEISLPGAIFDAYRQFKINSSKEIPSDTGPITDLFIKEANMFTHTTGNLWRFNINPQQLKTNNDTIQVGQGAFLGTKPIKMFDNKQGVSKGGTEFKWASVYSDSAFIWIDAISGTVYKMQQGIQEISSLGMNRWFANNTEINLRLQFMELMEIDYPFLGTSCFKNVGYIACYDPVHERYILHKRDFKILPDVLSAMLPLPASAANVTANTVYYNEEGFWLGISDGDPAVVLDITQPAFSSNESWTTSFALDENVWASFHSYLPNFMYNDSKYYYSFNNNPTYNDKTWRHLQGSFQEYYESKEDFVVEYVLNPTPIVESSFDTVEYTSNVYEYSDVDDRWIEIQFNTFDRIYVYNNNQMSGLKTIDIKNLVPYAAIQYNVGGVTAHKQRNYWRINRLRDLSIDRDLNAEPLFTRDWAEASYSSQFDNGFGFIDHVVNPAIVDITKNNYKLTRFTDKYLGFRLFYNPINNYKIVTNFVTGLTRNKI